MFDPSTNAASTYVLSGVSCRQLSGHLGRVDQNCGIPVLQKYWLRYQQRSGRMVYMDQYGICDRASRIECVWVQMPGFVFVLKSEIVIVVEAPLPVLELCIPVSR